MFVKVAAAPDLQKALVVGAVVAVRIALTVALQGELRHEQGAPGP